MSAYFLYYILSIVMIPGVILGIVAQVKVKTTFNKFNSVSTHRKRAAKDVARIMLDGANYNETQITQIKGELTDNYNPTTDTVSLSQSVANKSSVAAVGVAAHEIGHVFQHKEKYLPLKIRSSLVHVIKATSYFTWPLIIIGLVAELFYLATWAPAFIYLGIGIYGLNTIFCLITLPVELNASKRAYNMLISTNELDVEEAQDAKKVLNAAALTYVASLITSILSLLRLAFYVMSFRRIGKN